MKQPTLSNAGADTNLRILSMEEQAAIRSALNIVNPPLRQWVGLTDNEIENILNCNRGEFIAILKTQQILKRKNT